MLLFVLHSDVKYKAKIVAKSCDETDSCEPISQTSDDTKQKSRSVIHDSFLPSQTMNKNTENGSKSVTITSTFIKCPI